MYATIINNYDTIPNDIIIRYGINSNKNELLRLVPNPKTKDILTILSIMRELKYYIFPSTIYLNSIKFENAFDCFMYIKYLYLTEYNNIIKFLTGDNYNLTDEEFEIWIKNFYCCIPDDSDFSFDIIRLHEYVKQNRNNDIYEEFMQNYINNDYVIKFIFSADSSFFINELNNKYFVTILEYHFNIGINIINNVNFDKIVNIFENIAPVIDKKVAFYLCTEYNTDYFYKYSKNNGCVQTDIKFKSETNNNICTYTLDNRELSFSTHSLAWWLVNTIELKNCNTLNDIQNKWNEYYEKITNNELLMYEDNYIIYDEWSCLILFSINNDTVLVIPSFTRNINDLSKTVDVTKYRSTLFYLLKNNILIKFSELIKKYSDDFLILYDTCQI